MICIIVIIQKNPSELFQCSDVIIDFTIAAITKSHTALAVKYNTKLILGTTGHNENQLNTINEAAKNITIVKAEFLN